MNEADPIDACFAEIMASLKEYEAHSEVTEQIIAKVSVQVKSLKEAVTRASSAITSQDEVLVLVNKLLVSSNKLENVFYNCKSQVAAIESSTQSKVFSRLPLEIVELIILAVKNLHGSTPIERWDNLRRCASVCVLWHVIAAPLHLQQLHLRSLKDLGRVL